MAFVINSERVKVKTPEAFSHPSHVHALGDRCRIGLKSTICE